MKHFNILKFARIGALVLCLTVLAAVSTSAQSGNTNGAANRTETRTVERDNGFDWGWLGLLGLAGLAGLLPKKRTVEVRTNQTTDRR